MKIEQLKFEYTKMEFVTIYRLSAPLENPWADTATATSLRLHRNYFTKSFVRISFLSCLS